MDVFNKDGSIIKDGIIIYSRHSSSSLSHSLPLFEYPPFSLSHDFFRSPFFRKGLGGKVCCLLVCFIELHAFYF